MFSYRREIDGLRALAVVPVIFFHAGFEAFSGGFVGVDVFFVISGYLITSIILAQRAGGGAGFSLLNFYERRARRILPALFLVMAVCIPFAWLWLLPSDMKDFSQSLVAVSLFASNILFWKESGYFDTAAELKPLLHTWSLAVEEQYYLLFPLFLLAMWRFAKRWTVSTLAVIAILSFAVAQWGAYNKPAATFFLLPTRGWEIAIGALAAFYFARYPRLQLQRSVQETGSFIGLLLILYAVFAYSKETPFPSAYALAPTLGAALIILCTTPSTLVGRVLTTKAFVGIGLISYSAYLWHQPLFAFARNRSFTDLPTWAYLGLTIISMFLAYLTWRYIEVPARVKEVVSRRKLILACGLLTVGFVLVGFAGHLTNGTYGNQEAQTKLITLEDRLRVNHGLDPDCEGVFTTSPKCRTSDDPEIMVWGDSYAMHLVAGLKASARDPKIIQTTVSVCGPFFDIAPLNEKYVRTWAEECLRSNAKVLELLSKTSSIKYVVLSSPFSQYVSDKAMVLTKDGTVLNGAEVSRDYMRETINKILALGKVPIVFSPTPQNGSNIGKCLMKAEKFSKDSAVCDFSFGEAKKRQEPVWKFLNDISSFVKVIYLHDEICSGGACRASMGDVWIYRDSGHLSHEGSALLGTQMRFYDLVVRSEKQEAK